MKSTIPVLIGFIIFCSTPLSAAASSTDKIGLLKNISGDVMIQRQETKISGQKGVTLMRTDRLTTKDESYAGIIFNDGTTFTVGPNTEFDINNYKFEPDKKLYDFSVYIKRGSIVYNSGKIGKLSPESVKITTPRATVSIRGTRFIINVE